MEKHTNKIHMKTTTRYFFFPLIFNMLININNAYPQMPSFMPDANSNELKDTCIIGFTAKYIEDTVYFVVNINGLDKTSVFYVERSLDGKSFENIGSFIHYGNPVKINIMKCFQDIAPYIFNAFYRVVRYDNQGNKCTSETACVFPAICLATQPLQALTE